MAVYDLSILDGISDSLTASNRAPLLASFFPVYFFSKLTNRVPNFVQNREFPMSRSPAFVTWQRT